MRPGVRIPYWWSMLDAILQEPIWGYGWLQVAAAQVHVALEHPNIGAIFEYSHNIVLDLLLWNGIPIGAVIVSVLAYWLFSMLKFCTSPRSTWMLLVVLGILTHAMLEHPIAYAYFLVPLGLAMGGTEGFSSNSLKFFRWPSCAVFFFAASFAVLSASLVTEYFDTEERFRTLRFEIARIGERSIEPPISGVHLLTQLDAFLDFFRNEAHRGMSIDQLEIMRKVAERYPFSTVLLRYSLASGLNGQPDDARDALEKVCAIHVAKRCVEVRENWIVLQDRYPELQLIPPPMAQ